MTRKKTKTKTKTNPKTNPKTETETNPKTETKTIPKTKTKPKTNLYPRLSRHMMTSVEDADGFVISLRLVPFHAVNGDLAQHYNWNLAE